MAKTYSEKLKDPKWQRKRLEILDRDNFTCQICEDTEKTLHVHHKYYKKGAEPWEYENESLVSLCWECHECEENYKKEYEQLLITTIYDMGLMSDDILTIASAFHHIAEQAKDIDKRRLSAVLSYHMGNMGKLIDTEKAYLDFVKTLRF
jgi:hypothetical protein